MKSLAFDARRKGLLLLSFGAGQDSTTLLYKFILDKQFRDGQLKGRNLVTVFADTGNERKATYDHAWMINDLCKQHGIKFVQLASEWTKNMHAKNGRDVGHLVSGYHSDSWSSLSVQYERNSNLAIRNNKSCTLNLKINPIYRWLDGFCDELMDSDGTGHYGKKHLVEYSAKYGKVEVIIGFTKGEERRIKKAGKPGKQKWWESIEKTFPLATDLKMDRLDCIKFLKDCPYPDCPPSMCKMCPNITKHTLIIMWHFDRWAFIEWCRHERAKIKKWGPVQLEKGKPNSHALGGKKNLIEELRAAMKKYEHMTLDEIREYDYSHGHCISNGY